MNKIGEIILEIEGFEGIETLNPDNFDISELKVILDNIEDMVYPNIGKKSRPLISYSVEEGCVRNIFKTNLQGVTTFYAVAAMIASSGNLDGLDKTTANAFANLQRQSIAKDYSISFKRENETVLTIDKTTSFFVQSSILIDAEFYFYGTLTRAGGSSKPNIRLQTKDFGNITIYASKKKLADIKENVLYEDCAVRAQGKIDLQTGERDLSTLNLLEIIDYSAKYNEHYLDGLIKKASDTWRGVDANKWVRELRGDLAYE